MSDHKHNFQKISTSQHRISFVAERKVIEDIETYIFQCSDCKEIFTTDDPKYKEINQFESESNK